jgi:hypothetical protein
MKIPIWRPSEDDGTPLPMWGLVVLNIGAVAGGVAAFVALLELARYVAIREPLGSPFLRVNVLVIMIFAAMASVVLKASNQTLYGALETTIATAAGWHFLGAGTGAPGEWFATLLAFTGVIYFMHRGFWNIREGNLKKRVKQKS